MSQPFETATDLEFMTTKEFLNFTWDLYKEKAKDPDQFRPLPLLVPELTAAMGGLDKGTFVVFGAPPKGGKSAALLSCVSYISKHKPSALIGFISNEMWKEQLGRAFISNISHVNRGRIKNIDLDAGEIEKVDRALRDHGNGINCAWEWNITKFDVLDTWIRMVQDKHSAPMEYLIIDYIHLMDGQGTSPIQRIPWITREMKRLTHTFNGMCVISAAQLNNDHIKNENWSHTAFLYGGVDRDADAGIIIAPHKDDSGRKIDGVKELHTPIVREGEGGMVKMAFRGEYALLTGTAPDPLDDAAARVANLRFM